MRLRCLLAVLAACSAMFAAGPARAAPPPVKHVFVVVLENRNYDEVWGPKSQAPYLSKDLVSQGQLLTQYFGITHESLGNYLGMISGQGSNPYTQADAPLFVDFVPGSISDDGQAIGQGSVYPANVKTVADQLTQKGLTWKGYMEDMGTPCRHPAPGAPDDTQSARADDQYATRHNPFVYFHSIIDTPACAANVVPLERLPADLRSAATTPNYVFITPDLCSDGHDEPCIDGRPGGFVSVNAFLQEWVPRIRDSPAYKQDGLLIVTLDEARSSDHGDEGADSSGCCGTPQYPNTPSNGGRNPGPGGGRIGALLVSPFIAPGTQNATPYNHFSLLRSVEDIFGLGHLGYAGRPDLKAFGDDVFTAAGGVRPDGGGPGAGGTRCRSRRLSAQPRRGRFPRGTMVETATVRRGAKPRLSLRLTHTARVVITARQGSRTRRIVRRRAAPCRSYTFALPFGHGRARVRVSVARGAEVRSLRY